MMERKFYTIDENIARAANDLNYSREYVPGSATAIYRDYVENAYKNAEKVAESKPNLAEKAEWMAGSYSKKMADYWNAYYRNEASCPSVLISGAGNFPVGKKKRQNARRDALSKEWGELVERAHRIERMITMDQPILSSDEKAIELLREKLSGLEELQGKMRAANAYWRKNGNIDGCSDLAESEQEERKEIMEQRWRVGMAPYGSYELSNNNAKINNTRARLKRLEELKDRGTKEAKNEFFKAVENTDLMRLQLFFEGKPDESTRTIVKRHGFRWSLKNGCWQRQLTPNARFAMKHVINDLQNDKHE